MYVSDVEKKIIMVFAIVVLLATMGFIYYVYPSSKDTTYEDTKNFVIKAFQDGDFKVMWNYTLHADEKNIARNPQLLVNHGKGWFSFPGELRSEIGPWKYDVMIWYNKNTNQTHIQKI